MTLQNRAWPAGRSAGSGEISCPSGSLGSSQITMNEPFFGHSRNGLPGRGPIVTSRWVASYLYSSVFPHRRNTRCLHFSSIFAYDSSPLDAKVGGHSLRFCLSLGFPLTPWALKAGHQFVRQSVKTNGWEELIVEHGECVRVTPPTVGRLLFLLPVHALARLRLTCRRTATGLAATGSPPKRWRAEKGGGAQTAGWCYAYALGHLNNQFFP